MTREIVAVPDMIQLAETKRSSGKSLEHSYAHYGAEYQLFQIEETVGRQEAHK